MSDQAALLREMVGRSVEGRHSRAVTGEHLADATPGANQADADAPSVAKHQPPAATATAIAVTSGKGGVGKSNLSVNLALALARSGDRVALVDADLGLANADVLCGVQPLATLEQCLSLRQPLLECAVQAPGGFTLVPGASGVAKLADLDGADRAWLLDQIGSIADGVDWLIIDTGAGIGANTIAFAAAADRSFVVSTPEPPSMADAYGMIKTLVPRVGRGVVQLVVNQARDEEEARGVWLRLDRVTRAFLAQELPLAEWIPFDASLPQAVRGRVPLLVQSPGSAAARRIVQWSRRLREGDEAASVLLGAMGGPFGGAGVNGRTGGVGRGARVGSVGGVGYGAGSDRAGHDRDARRSGSFLGRLSRLFLGPAEVGTRR